MAQTPRHVTVDVTGRMSMENFRMLRDPSEGIEVRLVTRRIVHLEPTVRLSEVPEWVEFALSKQWSGELLGVDVRGYGDDWEVRVVIRAD